MSHLNEDKYEVIPVGITRDGAWTAGESDYSLLRRNGDVLPEVTPRTPLSLSMNTPGALINTENAEKFAEVDVTFPVLHGQFGEDGTIQGLFEMAQVPYVGPGVLASAAGMDKQFTKQLTTAAGIPATPEVILIDGSELTDSDKDRLGLPVFVKPARGGSSIGISKVDNWDELPKALEIARETDDKVIVEAMVHGAEIEVGVLEYPDGRLVASEIAQLHGTEDSEEGFYGYETKYLEDSVTATIPAQLPEETTQQVKGMALTAFRALGCAGLARVDFFISDDGPVLNEINTMPGFTPISMYPQVFATTGIAYEELLDTLIQTALATR